jgi:hypothetical protein
VTGPLGLHPFSKSMENIMPEKRTLERARKDRQQGKSPSTQAGEFVKEEIEHIRKGKHGARSAKQAIAIGLSKARRAGVKLAPQPGAKKRAQTTQSISAKKPSRRRSQAILEVLKKEPKSAASHKSLSKQAHAAAKKRGPAARHKAAEKAVRTKGPKVLKTAARKAARTRAEHARHP